MYPKPRFNTQQNEYESKFVELLASKPSPWQKLTGFSHNFWTHDTQQADCSTKWNAMRGGRKKKRKKEEEEKKAILKFEHNCCSH